MNKTEYFLLILVLSIMIISITTIETQAEYPLVNYITGTLFQGEKAVINGSSFGSHTLDIEWTGDNIEAGIIGEPFAKNGWSNSTPSSGFQPVEYSSEKAHTGNKSLKSYWPITQWGSGIYYDTGGNLNGGFYVTWWVYYEHFNADGQWKIWRLRNNSSVNDSQGEIYSSQWFTTDGTLLQNYDLIFCGMPGTNGTLYSAGCCNGIPPALNTYWGNESGFINPGKWIRYEMYAKESSSAGIRDAIQKIWIHKQNAPIIFYRNRESYPSRDLSLSYINGQNNPSSDRIFIKGQSSSATAWLTGWKDDNTGLNVTSTGNLYIDYVSGNFQPGENILEGTQVICTANDIPRDTIARWRYFHFQNYRGNVSIGDSHQEKVYLDDIYIQNNSQARIEIGNAATWTACTHREIQIPTAWSDNAINVTFNQGSFNNGDTVYLYVVDENGVASEGYPITIGGIITPPEGIKGDLNSDGKVDSSDIQACVEHILGAQDYGTKADVNGDDKADILDVQIILNKILGN